MSKQKNYFRGFIKLQSILGTWCLALQHIFHAEACHMEVQSKMGPGTNIFCNHLYLSKIKPRGIMTFFKSSS